MKYRITSNMVTAKLEGYVEADNEDEAKEKWFEGNTIGEIDEYPEREEVNVEVEADE